MDRMHDLIGGLTPIVVLILLMNVALLVITGPTPALLRYLEVINPDEANSVAARIVAAEGSLLHAEAGTHKELVVVIGMSTAREGIDPAFFEQGMDNRIRLLNLGSSGGSFRELRANFDYLFKGRLRPRVLILALHPAWLAGHMLQESLPPTIGELFTLMFHHGPLAKGSPTAIKKFASHWFWPIGNQDRIHIALRGWLLSVHTQIGELFSLGPNFLFQSLPADPWKPTIKYTSPRASSEFWREQIEAWEKYGWFDSTRYAVESDEARDFGVLLRKAHSFAEQTVVVLMPESVTLRSRVPLNAETNLRQILARETNGVPVFDFRAALPEKSFYDNAHPNKAGRECLSQLMAEHIVQLPQYDDGRPLTSPCG